MDLEDIANDDSKDEPENPEISSNNNEAKHLKEIVSIRSEESIADAASKHIEATLSRLKASSSVQSTVLKDSGKSTDGAKSGAKLTEEKTELDRRVRAGEITPFQAAENIESRNTANGKWRSSETAGLLGLEHYLKRQAELLEQRKKQKNIKAQPPKEARKSSGKPKRKSDSEVSASVVRKKAKISGSDDSLTTVDRAILRVPKNPTEQQDPISEDADRLKRSHSPEAGSQESGSEYVPSDGEIADSDAELEGKRRGQGKKKIRKKGEKLSENSFAGSKKIYDDGDESLYKERMDAKLRGSSKKDALFTVDNLFKVPKFIWKRLYGYQKVSVRWLWELHGRGLGGLLGDEMGLGKTVQVIAFLAGLDASELLSDGERFRGLGPTLIVCPATLLEQWVKHFQDWYPTLRVVILHHSGTYRGEPEYLVESMMRTGGILLTSYSGVLGHRDLLVEFQWHYVILDEGHKIRNPEAKISKAVKSFSTPHRLLLTGSPMQNSLKELWSLFDFILPGKLGTLGTFLEHCANPITRGGYANASPLQEATALHVATMLKDAIAPYMLRRTKNDVQHHISLPEKNEQVLFCCLTEEQTNLYKEYLRTDHVSSVLHDRGNCTENSYRARLLVALTALRKICNHPDLYTYGKAEVDSDQEISPIEEAIEKFGDWKRSGKLAVVRSLLRIWKRQGHRVLLFTQGRQMMGVLEALVQREGYEYLRLDGTTPMSQRQHTVHKFNNDPTYFVFVSTTRVGGLGINLTGADRVVIYDPDWNPAIDAQARERAWRIGQDKRVTIYRLITAGTVEEKIYHRQIFKVLLSNRILENPQQRRLFQTSDLAELFNLNDPIDGKATESDRIFSNCKLKPVGPKFSPRKVEAMRKLASSVSKKIEEISRKSNSKESEINATETSTSEVEKLEESPEKTDSAEVEVNSREPSTSEPQKLEETSTKLDSEEANSTLTSSLEIQEPKKSRKKKRRKSRKKDRDELAAESSAIFEGEKVPCLIGRRLGRSDSEQQVSSICDDQYVLMKLFSKTNVSSAYQHDAVLSQAKMGGDQVNPMHRMARDAAEESMDIIRKSRKWCWRPTWDTPRRNDE